MQNLEYVQENPIYINLKKDNSLSLFCHHLSYYLESHLPKHNNELVLICIGTDRATGDSLGPLVGYKLKDMNYSKVNVYGNLDYPVHAKNLKPTLKHIEKQHPTALTIAIDACLGAAHNVGCLTIGEGAIRPGAGVDKDLPAVGHLHITGIVNFSSLMNMVILQNTRLSLVMQMADIISSGLKHCLWNCYHNTH